jgi:thiol-disulfide isomerase/thioredoxin
VLSGCSSLSGTGDKGYITGDGVVTQVAEADRTDPVELSGEDLDGNAVDLADLRGRVAVVNVWGSWGPPCRSEQADLVAAAGATSDVAGFLGVNVRETSVDNARAYVRTFDVPYPSVHDPSSRALLAFAGTLPPRSIPSTVVLDREGRVAASILGPLPSQQTLIDLVEEIGAEEAGADG